MAHSSPIFLSQRNLKNPTRYNDKNTTLMEKEGFEKCKSNASYEGKCPVYIHQFNRHQSENCWKTGNEIHQSTYKHEYGDFYEGKINILKKHFDNLSLNSKEKINSPSGRNFKFSNMRSNKYPVNDGINYYNRATRIPQVKSSLTAKINRACLFRPENKPALDRLEETYWAKWKPTKNADANQAQPKPKGLYTEKEKSKPQYRVTVTNERKERGDSRETLDMLVASKHKLSDVNFFQVDEAPSKSLRHSSMSVNIEAPVSDKNDNLRVTLEEEEEEEEERFENDETNSNNVNLILLPERNNSESDVVNLKHTDSLILTARKKHHKKLQYQQPKCIKLFKKTGYTTSAPTYYVKGGTYPLKSCLKAERVVTKTPSHLGRPGGPIVASGSLRVTGANRLIN